MLHCFKSARQKLAYDTVSGAVIPLTSLEYKMLQAIIPPLSPMCPSSLRYELAKFDSADVDEAYGRIYALSLQGILFADGNGNAVPVVRLGVPYGLMQTDEVVHDLASLLGGCTPELHVQDGISSQTVSEIRAVLCKNV